MIYSNVSEVPNDIFSHDNASMTEYVIVAIFFEISIIGY